MADLAEIMAGKGDSTPEPGPQTRREPTAIVEQTMRPDPVPPAQPQGQEPTGQPDPNNPPQDDQDPISGLRKGLDAEREKRRKYRDELAEVRQQLQGFQSQFSGFMQAFQAQQRPQQPQAPAQPAMTPEDEINQILSQPGAFIDGRLQQTVKQAVEPLAATQQQQREQFSRMMAVDKFGEETVNSAFNDLASRIQSDPNVRFDWQRIMASPHPFGALVQWHQQQSALNEIGPDPKAYREKLRSELLAELQAAQSPQGQQAPQAAAPQSMPTSFAQARNAGPRTTPGWTGPKPLSELMNR